jgi:hypothetical protein
MSTAEQRQEWARLEQRLEQDAADGEWAADGKTVVIWRDDERYHEIIADTFDERNAAFIAASRAAVPALLADVDRLTGDNAALSEALDTALAHLKESEADRDKAVTMLGDEAIAHSRTRRERDALAAELAQVREQLATAQLDDPIIYEPMMHKASTRPLWTEPHAQA